MTVARASRILGGIVELTKRDEMLEQAKNNDTA